MEPKPLQRTDVDKYVDPDADFQTGWWLQYETLARRNFKRQIDHYFSKLNFVQILFLAVFSGMCWFDLERTEEVSHDRLLLVINQSINVVFTGRQHSLHQYLRTLACLSVTPRDPIKMT